MMAAARAFRLTAPELPERDIHTVCAQVLDRLLAEPAAWACYPAGAAQLSPQQMARYSRLGLKRGMPDLLIFFDGVWGIELKRHGGRLSKTRIGRTRRGAPRILEGQEDVFPKLLAAGFKGIAICRSADEMLTQLKHWGIPLRAFS
jgi:hypothetical protein